MRPHRRQPTRLCHPWDSPGKNTGVGCHFLLQCRKVKSLSEVAQSSLTFRDPMDCSLPGSSVHGIFQGQKCPRDVSILRIQRQITRLHWFGANFHYGNDSLGGFLTMHLLYDYSFALPVANLTSFLSLPTIRAKC